jgi:hypothetical protein
MGNPRSRQPAHVRPVRRSLVELTAAAVSSAARDGVRVTPPAPIATFFEDVKAGETAAENSDQLTTSITVAPPAVEAVEDRRAPVRQKLKVSVSPSPGDVNDIASPEEPATQEVNSSHDAVNSEKTIPAATISAIVADYQAKALGLTEANMSATLEFAQQLVNLRSASDFIKLSSMHARTQIELMIKQSSELRSLVRNLTPSYDTVTAVDPQVLTKSTDRP